MHIEKIHGTIYEVDWLNLFCLTVTNWPSIKSELAQIINQKTYTIHTVPFGGINTAVG